MIIAQIPDTKSDTGEDLTPHIRSRGEEARDLRADLGQRARRWIVERVHSWINGYRGLLIR